MKKHFIIFGIFLMIGMQYCYSNNHIEISLLTCSSGNESFSSWGHSAVRIIDTNDSIDIVYNFGLFDFNTPNFYTKFIKGKLKYRLGIQDTPDFYKGYEFENRQVTEQKLNLSEENKIKIIDRLKYLCKPENRYYNYDFLDKNCTTELRDLIFSNVETGFNNQITNKTYRTSVNQYLMNKLWLKLGINLLFGNRVDRKIDSYESMFLPDYLYLELNELKVHDKNLVINKSELIENEMVKSNYPILLNPLLIFSILTILVLIINSSKVQLTVFLITGIVGFLILSISLITEHQALKNNFNLLWCNPLYFISALLQLNGKKQFQMYLSIVLQTMIFGMIIIWLTQIQSAESAFFPISLMLTIFNLRVVKTGYNQILRPNQVYQNPIKLGT